MRRSSLGLVLAFLACAGAAAQDRRPIDLLSGVERRVLHNGLAVIARPDRRLPTVTAMLAYRVGSVNEEPGLTGMAHFFEHMVFKGSAKYKPGDIDLVTYRCGGENNAFTTHDMTGYWFHVGASHLDEVLDILADTLGRCTIDPREFDRERNTVLQEMNIWLDGPWGGLERELDKAVYQESRYRHPVLGWKEDVEKLTRDGLAEFYRRHYQPQNASLIVVGDIAPAEVFAKAEKFFAGLPKGEPSPAPKAAEPPQKAERTFELPTSQTADRFMMAFRADRAGTPADLALDVLAVLLSEGRTSRLQTRLVDKEDLAGQEGVSSNNYSRQHEGVFTVKVELALEASLAKAREVVIEELEALKKKPVGERELRRAKNIVRARFAFEGESQLELTSKMGYFEALGLPDYVGRYMDRIEAVTPELIQETARRVFTAENRTVAVGRAKAKRDPAVRPSKRSPRGTEGRRSGPRAVQGAPVLKGVRQTTLPNGLRVMVAPRRDVPVLAVQCFVNAGPLLEPEAKAGVASLTGDLLDEGIEDDAGRWRSGDQLASEIEFVGGDLATGPTGAACKVLSEHATLAFDMIRDVVRYPSFPAERFSEVKDDLLAEIQAQDDDPQRAARRLFFEEAYRGHPLRRPASGYKATVENVTLDDVKAHYARFFRPENAVIAVAGDIDPDRALEEVKVRFGGWAGKGAWAAPALPAARRQSGPRERYQTADAQQARIVMGHVGVERTHPDWATLRVAETILGTAPGFVSRLAKNVRDVQGLAYDVHGSITQGGTEAPAPFMVLLGVEAKDKDKGIAAVREELRKFMEEGPTEREVEDAKAYLRASFTDAWELCDDLGAYLVDLSRYRLGVDWPEHYFDALSKVGREDVRRAAAKHLDLGGLTTVVVGPVDEKGNLLEGGRPK
jgi:zinc protease